MCSFCGKAGHIHQDCRVKQRVRNQEQVENEGRDCFEETLRDPAESRRDWEYPGVYPKWEPHPDGFELLNRGRPSTQVRSPDPRRGPLSRHVWMDEPMPRRDPVGCSFCGEVGHMYTSCALLQQMVQEQAEQLQQHRTEEYRAVQSRSVRQSIIEEYGEDDSMPRREDACTDRRVPSACGRGDPVPPSRMGHGGPLPYPAMMPATRTTHKWEEEMPRDGTQVTEGGYSAAHGIGTGGVYFPRYQRPASTSTPYESYGRGYTGEAGAPAGGPLGGGRRPPWGGPGGGGGGYDPDDSGDDEEEDDDSDASDGDPRERVRRSSIPRRRHLVSTPGGTPPDDPDPDGGDTHALMRGMRRRRGQRGGIGQPRAPRMPEYAGTPGHGPLTLTGLGEPPSLNFTANTLGVENSLRYMRDSMNRLLEAQQPKIPLTWGRHPFSRWTYPLGTVPRLVKNHIR